MTDEPSDIAAPDLLPLDAWHRARGARMVSFAGYSMPIQYDGIVAEHLWTREHAGLFDVSHMGQLLLSGDGLDEALEALIPADVRSIKPGHQKYSLLLDANGGILDDLMLARWSDGIYIVVNGAVKYDDIAHLREHLPDAITLNHLDDHALLALQGPEAFAVLARHATGDTPLDALVFMTGARFTIAGVDTWVRTALKSRSPPPMSPRSPNCSAPSPRSSRSGWARAIRCGSRPACRFMATTSRPTMTRSKET